MISLAVTNGRARSPAEWAELAVRKVVTVSDSAPPPIRDQAHAFREQVRRVVENYIAMAVDERRSRDAMLAETAAQRDVAEAIRKD
jgi:hypothetical protein